MNDQPTTPAPAVGQIWQDNDKRSHGRRVRIVAIDDATPDPQPNRATRRTK